MFWKEQILSLISLEMLAKQYQSYCCRCFSIERRVILLNSIFRRYDLSFLQFSYNPYNESRIAIRSRFQRDVTLIQWGTMKNRRLEDGISFCQLNVELLIEIVVRGGEKERGGGGLITAPWQAKRNIANQIHKKVGHLLSRAISVSFAPFSLWIVSSSNRPFSPPARRLLFMHDKRQTIHLLESFYGTCRSICEIIS